jgi:hypothetical protein
MVELKKHLQYIYVYIAFSSTIYAFRVSCIYLVPIQIFMVYLPRSTRERARVLFPAGKPKNVPQENKFVVPLIYVVVFFFKNYIFVVL